MYHSRLPGWKKEGHQEVSSKPFPYRCVLIECSKRDGLEKAVYRIEQAIKRSKTQGSRSEDEQNTFHLQNLLNEAQGLLPRQNLNLDPALQVRGVQPARQDQLGQPMTGAEILGDPNSDDHFALDDAENPLQLLARASDLTVPPNHSTYSHNVPTPTSLPSRSSQGRDLDLQTFFGPFRPSLDVGETIDPIENGLVTTEEVDGLFT